MGITLAAYLFPTVLPVSAVAQKFQDPRTTSWGCRQTPWGRRILGWSSPATDIVRQGQIRRAGTGEPAPAGLLRSVGNRVVIWLSYWCPLRVLGSDHPYFLQNVPCRPEITHIQSEEIGP